MNTVIRIAPVSYSLKSDQSIWLLYSHFAFHLMFSSSHSVMSHNFTKL